LRLSLARGITEPDPSLISVSAEILSLAVEAAVLRHHLANSGTGIWWKVRYSLPLLSSSYYTLVSRVGILAYDGYIIEGIELC